MTSMLWGRRDHEPARDAGGVWICGYADSDAPASIRSSTASASRYKRAVFGAFTGRQIRSEFARPLVELPACARRIVPARSDRNRPEGE